MQACGGGLAPSALRRVQEYVDAHLSDNLNLQSLADTAGLSLHHFARAFKRSTAVTPHTYLLKRRIDRARELLTHSDRSLAEIALVTGFADQSHFARRFLEIVGVRPGQFRRFQRLQTAAT